MKRRLSRGFGDSACAGEQAKRQRPQTADKTAMELKIELTEREKRLERLLLDVAAFVDGGADRQGTQPLVLRWAGGWVRDRLLGRESHDIDTAIDTMTGFAFALKMQEFCGMAANAARHGMEPRDLGSLHKVEANPDKSKHLETATVRIFDMEVDFVNLRRETYTAESRNPLVEFGTPEEDALRRDATVNALFYNLNCGTVEDFTGGVADMEARLIRTPLQPLQTFTDDPLRVLRLVRFASRLQFRIDPAAEAVMADPSVLQALQQKISRERVGTEVEKMLKGNHPRDSLQLIDRLGLYHAIFTDPAHADAPKPRLDGWTATYETLNHLAATTTPGSVYDVLVRTEEAQYFAWVLAAAVPWDQVSEQGGIRAPNKLSDVITGAHRHRADILALKQAVCDGAPCMRERDRFGMAIRTWEARGSNWKLQVLYALLFEVLTLATKQAEGAGTAAAWTAERDALLCGWQAFLDHLQELDVLDAPHIKRLLDGKQVAAALAVRPGKWMAAAMDICMAWQLRHPGETDPAGAIEEVRRRKDEIGLS
ncbi:tRNA nucleotidyltransferase [Grosmannia clavigera kw1407]|uniref:tRNA nucleotidyltransferase n=1 Tax=Grosmannia clavigera (strain kw1407 / UAMH 11150) TaxID=655863 RepID=F0XFD0_GROCL|nr:tRNA nucleotidyltransferase [Grosmannia clavigera kw1407]EFX04213.1 tRNA nucleotidyltransferase [Grosmannia clavigera kw1407]